MICGGEFVLGTDRHANCRAIEAQQIERNKRIDKMLKWYEQMEHKYGSDFIEDLYYRTDNEEY
jgi:hypothetical protein